MKKYLATKIAIVLAVVMVFMNLQPVKIYGLDNTSTGTLGAVGDIIFSSEGEYYDYSSGWETDRLLACGSLGDDGVGWMKSALRFDLSGITGEIISVKLKIYVNSVYDRSILDVYGTDDVGFVEATMDHGSGSLTPPQKRPDFPIQENAVTVSGSDTGTWKEVDVTGYVRSKHESATTIGFILAGTESPRNTAFTFYSREESGKEPTLEVTTKANAVKNHGILQFSPVTATVQENGDKATLTVNRTDGSDGAVTVDYSVNGGTASGSGVDYTLNSGTLSFAEGEISKTIEINIINDTDVESDETVIVSLSNPTGDAALGTDVTATLTIADDDKAVAYGKLQFNPKAVTVGEEKGTVDLTITRTDGSDGPATVDYAVTGGTATGSGTDYALVSGTISFANGESSKTIPLSITNDTKYEPSETIEVTLSNATGGATLGTDTVATITIVDDDAAYGKLQFNPKAVTVGEADGTVDLTITRTDGSDGPATVDYAVTGGTATGSGTDYTLASGNISFANGESSKTIPLSITNDTKYEPSETIEVTLSNATGATLGTDTVATITIVDDDAAYGKLQFNPNTVTVGEEKGSVDLTITRTDGSDGPATVDYAVTGGTATGSGTDYALASGTISFANGESSKTIPVSITNDTKYETDETIEVTLSNATGATLGTDTVATITIVDDDAAYGKLQFNPKAVTIGEADGTVNLTITRTDGSDGAATVDYAVTGGTATGSGTDYALASGNISFANGESSKTISVSITNDTKYEPSETIEVTLSNATGGATLGTDTVATITIVDDDAAYGKLQFNPKAVTVGEEKGSVDLTITRTDGSDGPVTLDYAVTGGTATGSGTDYALVSSTISFANGESSKSIPVTIANDTKYEPSETIEVTLSNATGGAILGTDTVATITIVDDDAVYGKLQFNPKAVTVGEEKGTVDLTVTRTDGSDGPVTVDYAVTGGTATGSGTDYALVSSTISFANGESSKSIPVTIANDTKYEPSETIEVTLSNATGGATLGIDTVATITIVDDDAVYGKLQFNPNTVTVGEEKGAVDLTITRTDGSDGAATVDYAVTGGTATGSGTDYALASGTISFANGESSKTIPVSITNDTKYETDETIEVTLSNATGATLGTDTVATITIVDDDAAYGKLQFNPKAVTIGEADGTVNLTITRTDGSDGAATVDYAVTGGTATGSGTDYALASGNISFANGESSKTISVSITNDTKYEPSETIEVTLSNATGGATLGTDTVATITIVDNDAVYGKLQFNPNTVTVGEEKGTVDLTVTRTDGSDGPVTVDYAVTGGTATGSGTDYTLASGNISFANGESSKTIPVTITNDTKYELDETIEVTLSNATGGAILGTDTVATITIVDDDAVYGKLQFNPKAVTIGEADGTVNLTITRTDGSDGPVTVDYAVTGGTATGSGTDYTLASGNISFANGESSKTIPVSITNDTKYEPSETIEVTLSNATGATLGTDTVATITIVDDDAAYGKLQFNPKAVTVGEEKGSVDLTITRTDGSDGAVTVDYAVTGGTATGSGTDYALASGTISFANGESSKTIPVSITNDTKYEPSETIEVTLSNATGATLGTDTVATITIVDDDAAYGKLQFNPKAVTVGEADGTVNLTITRTDGSDGPATVDYAVTGGTATGSGTDYALASGTISFANGESSKTIPVTIANDTKYEPSETIEVTLSNATGGATLGTDTVATITIVDDDAAYGKLQFNPKAVTIGEAAGSVNLTVTRTEGSDEAVTVDYTVTGGTATGNGEDYTLASGTLNFLDGETLKTIPVSIVDDTKYESNETIVVTLSSSNGELNRQAIRVATLGTNIEATITIIDNDKKPDSGGGGGGGSPSGNSETGKTNVPVIVDNKQENIGTQEVKGEKTTVVLDQDGLRDKLEKAGEGSQVTVPILNNTGSVSAQLVVQNVSDMAEKNILLEVQNGTVAYQIPTTAIDIKEIKAALGADVNLSNASFNVTITQSEKSKIQEVALSAKDKEFSVVVPPVEFEITASYQDKEYTLTDFSNFVTREVEISGEDAKRITTAIVYEKDGTVRHIPTFVHEKGGKWYAKINSRTNSTYVLIYNYASFKDTEGKWYHNVVTEMASRKVISDLYSEVFEGDKAITRAEFATIIVRGLGLPDENELTFSDVDENRGYAGAIATAARYGIIKGIGDNKFAPDAGITREEAMAMMQRAAALTPFVQTSEQRNLAIEFSDFGEESSWASDAVSWNINNNLIVGANGKIRPKDSITRAETVAVILRLLQKSELVDKRN